MVLHIQNAAYYANHAYTVLVALALLIAPGGCASKSPDPVAQTSGHKGPASTTDGSEHGHKAGTHGGLLVSIGSDSYHAEAVFSQGGNLRLYILGRDESIVQEVEEQNLLAFARLPDAVEAIEMKLLPTPQAGDQTGKTSLFTGMLPKELAGKPLEVTIPALRVGNERFRLAFQAKAKEREVAMPAALAPNEESNLFLSPGGKYSLADIKANGSVTASVKFRGIKANHDARPKPGDRLCPISLTLANPSFSWTINGKVYLFCCPPCVEEFVSLAKEKPAELKDPDFFIAK
ncbi:MAG: hypothetical protein DWI02_06560 [Planctomycetota bacterium]|nr:MAG: hypothetical protein DWI02_06560 [Planctomycetota bacterium]